MLREEGVPPHVYDDAKTIRALAFEYDEPALPRNFVVSSVSQLPLYAPSEWLTAAAPEPASLPLLGSERLLLPERMMASSRTLTLTAVALSPRRAKARYSSRLLSRPGEGQGEG